MKSTDDKKIAQNKRLVAICSLVVVIFFVAFLTYFLGVRFMSIASSGVEFNEFIHSYGAFGVFVAISLQVIQVFIALIPGEIVEIGLGFAYGWLGGSLLCLIGVAIASAMIFWLMKKFGIKLGQYFVSVSKINDLKFINDEKRFVRITFLLYLIPGTPKDLLTYFLALTKMSLKDFLAITIFARIPTVVSSAIGGDFLGEGKFVEAIVLFLITATISCVGYKAYDVMVKKLREKNITRASIISKAKSVYTKNDSENQN